MLSLKYECVKYALPAFCAAVSLIQIGGCKADVNTSTNSYELEAECDEIDDDCEWQLCISLQDAIDIERVELFRAILRNDLAFVQQLAPSSDWDMLGSDTSSIWSYQKTPLELAIFCGHHEIADFILRETLRTETVYDEYDRRLLRFAVAGVGGSSTIQWLFEAMSWDMTEFECPASLLIDAVTGAGLFCRLEETMIELLEFGCDPNSLARDGASPLAIVVSGWSCSRAPFAEQLIRAGADPNVGTIDGSPALHQALRLCDVDCISLLLGSGADPNKPDPSYRDYSPMHAAASFCSPEALRLLREFGAEITSLARLGETPLHVAAQYGNIAVAEWLLDAGANASVTDKEGRTPLDWARRRYSNDPSKESVVRLLEQTAGE